MSLFTTLKTTKSKNKHLIVVEALVEAGLLFDEIGDMIYKITNTRFKEVTLFARTCKLRLITSDKIEINLDATWEESVKILKAE